MAVKKRILFVVEAMAAAFSHALRILLRVMKYSIIIWNESTIGIEWSDVKAILSDKDKRRKSFIDNPIEFEV